MSNDPVSRTGRRVDDTIAGIIISVVSILIGVIIGYSRNFPFFKSDPVAYYALVSAITLSIVSAIISYTFRSWLRIFDIQKEAKSISQEIGVLSIMMEEFGAQSRIGKLVRNYDDVMRDTVGEFMSYYYAMIDADDDSFSVSSENIAIFLNERFWHKLMETKERYPATKITVRTTHSTSVHLMRRKDFLDSLARQGQFIRVGGENALITRIIEGNVPYQEVYASEPEGDSSASYYLRAIRRMEEYGTEVKYIYEAESSSLSDLMIVSIGNNGTLPDVAMLWHAPANSPIIHRCQLITARQHKTTMQELESKWFALEHEFKRQQDARDKEI